MSVHYLANKHYKNNNMNMPKLNISPAVRISFSLVLFAISVLLIVDLLGLIPKKSDMVLETRKRVSESLAVQLSVAATAENRFIVDSTLESFVDRNKDVLAAAMVRDSGEVVTKYGEFSHPVYQNTNEDLSQEDLIYIPIYAGSNRWGTINVEFVPVYQAGIWDYFRQSILGMMLIFTACCIVGYIFILRKALHFLDPNAVVPKRVRAAFNTLSEGVLILDNDEKIMMANDAFASQVDKEASALLGTKASAMKWRHVKSTGDDQLPWIKSLQHGVKKIGVALHLSTPHVGIRTMSANSAPILDEEGQARGTLVTFDDITDVEESNILLENAVTTLQKNDAEIRRKNQELEVLASRDALTGCFNRRAFFDLFEGMFQHAIDANTDVCCIMADIDHFKTINDRFGHAVGDEAIQMVADILNRCSHDGAIVGRYGGEEFCIALPETVLSTGQNVAEELRNQIKAITHDFGECKVNITVSFGVSSIDSAMESCSMMLEQADNALYTAKNSGRDRVVTWVDHASMENISNEPCDSEAEGPQVTEQNKNRSETQLQLLNNRIRALEHELDNKAMESEKDRFKDPITELPTRIIFEDRVTQAMAYSERAENIMSVAILSVDMFSRINDTMGQVVGDQFLKAVGQRLKTILRRSDTVASMIVPGQAGPSLSRLRDDKFALLLTGINTVESLTYIIKRIQEKFAGKINVADNEIIITTSIGLALYPDDGATPATLIEHAFSAQKHAKGMTGRNNYQFYLQHINQKIVRQMKLELDMHRAVERGEFSMVYQPKLELKNDTLNSMEALIRWNHPEDGVVSPLDFIPTAERSGIIVDIGQWCLRTVCEQTRKWIDQGAKDIRVSVNISAVEFGEDDFVNTISRILKEANLNAAHLELELTETTVMMDLEKSTKVIDELRFRGVTVSLDDFGTGYSSFNYLGNLNLDWIKIDRSFLLYAMKHERSKTLYNGMVKMAHDIGLKVVAEGIEEQSEYNYVQKLGVDEMQGYMLSKPIDVESMTRALFSSKTNRRKAS